MSNLLNDHKGMRPHPNEEHALVDEKDRRIAIKALVDIAFSVSDSHSKIDLCNKARNALGMRELKGE